MSETPQRLHATFDGAPISAEEGSSVAAALTASGRSSWRRTRAGEPRGLFCGIGVCFDCLVDIDGESGQRACMVPLREGMRITPTASAAASPTTDTREAPDTAGDAADSEGADTEDAVDPEGAA